MSVTFSSESERFEFLSFLQLGPIGNRCSESAGALGTVDSRSQSLHYEFPVFLYKLLIELSAPIDDAPVVLKVQSEMSGEQKAV